MADWQKSEAVLCSITPGITDKRIQIYHADQASTPPGHARLVVSGVDSQGRSFQFDYALSALDLTAEQTAALLAAAESAAALILSKAGFAPAS